MTVYDQFETEPYVFYSGSYIDDILFGSIFALSSKNTRTVVGSKTSGPISSSLYSVEINRNSLYDVINTKSTNKFISISTPDEILSDSVLPSPGSIILANGKKIPNLKFNFNAQISSGALPAAQNGIAAAMPEYAIHSFFSPDGKDIPGSLSVPVNDFADPQWAFSFPFQSKYKLLNRIRANYLSAEYVNISETLDGSAVTPVSSSRDLGSIFYTFSLNDIKKFSGYSQLWGVTSSYTTTNLNAPNSMAHVPMKSFNSINKIYFNNYRTSSSPVSGVYVAFEDNATIAYSLDGKSWEQIAVGRDLPGQYYASNAKSIPLVISSWTGTSGSILDALPIGYNNGTSSGVHYQWTMIVQDGSENGKFIRQTTRPNSNPIPSNTGWEYVNLDISTFTPDLKGIVRYFDNGGTITVASSGKSICIFGRDRYPSPNKGLILFTDKNAGTFTRNTSAVAQQNNYVWTGCVTNGSVTPFPIMYFIGTDTTTAGSPKGIVATLSETIGVSIDSATMADRSAAAQTAWGSTLPVIRGVDVRPSITNTVIIVGDSGLILRSTDGGVSWSKRTPANSFNKTFVSVKYRYGTVDQGTWIAVGDNGVVQYSTDDGLNWTSGKTEQPNLTSGLGDSLNKSLPVISPPYGPAYPSYHSLYAGSRERFENSDLMEPQFILGGGGRLSDQIFEAEGGNSTLLTVRIVDSSGSNPLVANNLIGSGLFPSGSSVAIKPSALEYNKAFFGFGDGAEVDLTDYIYGGIVSLPAAQKRSPALRNFSLYDFYGQVQVGQVQAYGTITRGWKYGISGFEVPTKMHFRIGNFGQFRDMLEQRLYTKFNVNDVTQEAAVSVTFVSGTVDFQQALDYVTASNPSYDPRDSGFWDYEYRSGQPFYDIENID